MGAALAGDSDLELPQGVIELFDVGEDSHRFILRARQRRVYAVHWRESPCIRRIKGLSMSGSRIAMRILGGVVLSLFAAGSLAQDSPEPSDVELHSMYCIPVLNYQIALTGEMANTQLAPGATSFAKDQVRNAQADLAKLQSARDRLKAYMLPRMSHRDPMALALAGNRGEKDVDQFKAAMKSIDQCAGGCSEDVACTSKCTTDGIDKDLVSRMQACRNPTWLPF
jgi:hypothetical protein